jgi:hypothetical protein
VILLAGLVSISSLFGNFALQNSYAQVGCTNWNGDADDDCDSLANEWEEAGSYNGVPLPGANSQKKDIYVEVDYMQFHRPRNGVLGPLDELTQRFEDAPVINQLPTTPSTEGIVLHVIIDDEIPHANLISWPTGFQNLKNTWFGTLADPKRDVYHYFIFAHSQAANPPSSGTAEIKGNDGLITLGHPGWGVDPATGHTVGSVEQQKGTFMHELGHNLNLRHGGNVDENCKPNYLSVMSYSFQFPNYDSDRPLDYSRRTQVKLDEKALVEANGVSASDPLGRDTVFGRSNQPSPPQVQVKPTGTALNYDWWSDSDTTDPVLQSSINNLGQSGCNSNTLTTWLFGYKDWALLTYWGTGGGFSNGTAQSNGNETTFGATLDTLQGDGNGTAPSNGNETTFGATLGTLQGDANATEYNRTATLCDPAEPNCYTPCDPDDRLCTNPINETSPDYPNEQTIDDIRQSRISLASSINQTIQQLPDTAFQNPALAGIAKMNIANDLFGNQDSIAILMASDRLDESIIKLLQLKGRVSPLSGAGSGDDLIIEPNAQRELAGMIENLIQALLKQR